MMKHLERNSRWFGLFVTTAIMACAADPDDGGGESDASFDVSGVWRGTASDQDTQLDVTLTLSNNGGSDGMSLAGTLEFAGVVTLDFSDGFIDPRAGATRISMLDASDDEGFTYTLTGTFTDQRMDDGRLVSSNPDVGADMVSLETALVKE
jgi:hypothetical protein